MNQVSHGNASKLEESIEIGSAASLHAWFATQPPERHTKGPGVWVIHYKKHVTDKYVPFGDIVRACLCVGWVDSKMKSLDGERVMHHLTPRRPNGTWSATNKRLVTELEELGAMTAAGRAAIDYAKLNGSWSFLDDIEALRIPPDLQAALDAEPPAAQTWAAYPKSEKKQTLLQLKTAKQPATRLRRLNKVLANARIGKRSWT